MKHKTCLNPSTKQITTKRNIVSNAEKGKTDPKPWTHKRHEPKTEPHPRISSMNQHSVPLNFKT